MLITPGNDYSLSCEALTGAGWTSQPLLMSDANCVIQAEQSIQISSASYLSYNTRQNAPADAFYAVLTLYADSDGRFNNCILTETSPVATTALSPGKAVVPCRSRSTATDRA